MAAAAGFEQQQPALELVAVGLDRSDMGRCARPVRDTGRGPCSERSVCENGDIRVQLVTDRTTLLSHTLTSRSNNSSSALCSA